MSKSFKDFLIAAFIMLVIILGFNYAANHDPLLVIEIGRIVFGIFFIIVPIFLLKRGIIDYNHAKIYKVETFSYLHKLGYLAYNLALLLLGIFLLSNAYSSSWASIFLILMGIGISLVAIRGILAKEFLYSKPSRYIPSLWPKYLTGKKAVRKATWSLIGGIFIIMLGLLGLIFWH